MSLASVESLRFDVRGLRMVDTGSAVRQWVTPVGDTLSLYFFDQPPDLTADIADTAALRRFYREQIAASGGGLIEADALRVADAPAVRLVLKLPQQPAGLSYLASLTLPFRDFSFVIKAHCIERGTTGLRETWVLDQALAGGEAQLDGEGKLQGWTRDPYGDPARQALMWNLSDARRFDARFPDHALSRARALLDRVEATLRLNDSLRGAAPFSGSRGKRWWKIW
jgi:hypothetical protein